MWRVAWLLWLVLSILIGVSAGAAVGIEFGFLSGILLFFIALIVDGQRSSIPARTVVHPRHDRYLSKTDHCEELPEEQPAWYDEHDFVAMPPVGDTDSPLYVAWLIREKARVERLRRRHEH
jgi:hypothetical protein